MWDNTDRFVIGIQIQHVLNLINDADKDINLG